MNEYVSTKIPNIFIPFFIRKIVGITILENNIWELKASCQKKLTRIKEVIYLSYLERYGAWIGINSHFETPPILPHGLFGIFVSNNAKIGKDVVIFQHVTIGSNTLADSKMNGSPTIGDKCYIGAGAKIIGKTYIGGGVA